MAKVTNKDIDFAIKLLISLDKRKKALKLFNIIFFGFSAALFLYLLMRFDFDLGRTVTIYLVYIIIFSAVYFGLRSAVMYFASSYLRHYNAKILGGYMFGRTYSESFEISLEDFINLTKVDFARLKVTNDYDTEYLDAKIIAEKEILNVKHKHKKFIF